MHSRCNVKHDRCSVQLEGYSLLNNRCEAAAAKDCIYTSWPSLSNDVSHCLACSTSACQQSRVGRHLFFTAQKNNVHGARYKATT